MTLIERILAEAWNGLGLILAISPSFLILWMCAQSRKKELEIKEQARELAEQNQKDYHQT